jgi:hypothetical protein
LRDHWTNGLCHTETLGRRTVRRTCRQTAYASSASDQDDAACYAGSKTFADQPRIGGISHQSACPRTARHPALPSDLWTYSGTSRELYQLTVPRLANRSKKEMPFKAERRHHYWSVDIRYVDMHRLKNEDKIYCISILENYSRARSWLPLSPVGRIRRPISRLRRERTW